MLSQSGGKPSRKLTKAINNDLNGYEGFRESFTKAAQRRFGSGWAWLTVGKDGGLLVASSANQDSPLMGHFAGMSVGTPVLGLNVWEHAYYLQYQNKRPRLRRRIFQPHQLGRSSTSLRSSACFPINGFASDLMLPLQSNTVGGESVLLTKSRDQEMTAERV